MSQKDDPRAAAEEALALAATPLYTLRTCERVAGRAVLLLPVLARAVLAERAPKVERTPECTGSSASWCPIHGDCSCPWIHDDPDNGRTLDGPGCPLHSEKSEHAREPEPPRFAWRGSVSDLATDIRGTLTEEQIAKLADESDE